MSLACVRMNFRFDLRSLGLLIFWFIWSIRKKNGNDSNSSFCVWEWLVFGHGGRCPSLHLYSAYIPEPLGVEHVDGETGVHRKRWLAQDCVTLVSGEQRFKSRWSGSRVNVLNIPSPSVTLWTERGHNLIYTVKGHARFLGERIEEGVEMMTSIRTGFLQVWPPDRYCDYLLPVCDKARVETERKHLDTHSTFDLVSRSDCMFISWGICFCCILPKYWFIMDWELNTKQNKTKRNKCPFITNSLRNSK